MNLTRTTDLIQVLCDSNETVHCFASWGDRDINSPAAVNVQHGSNLANVESTTAATLVPATTPKNNARCIGYMSFKAAIANAADVTVRVRLSDGTTTVDLFSAPLSPGDQIVFTPDNGFSVIPASGRQPSTADLITDFITELRAQTGQLE